ncbi:MULTISPECIES: ABC transporter ATP-binding protein [Brevibacillus]|uniref:ABC transporter ATP-binding protein n=1 Tax=Brevibacillus TaxID=55080 RepID=UPI000D108F98|nr:MULTISPECIES: ABC transporter ATP-binding protein [Brevibacillus]MBW5470159.1 ATP-binding cassette domain-containing protein [Brevibacillus formosus]MED1946599.1 ABC transporter ATP-binding protein [Brevibacillus formosus]MED1996857.1 ABC transporter ATP-binding protein [Brevibacillus formosus]MED2084774.1 ABC transporter ATP-binding protein [Brevibacillus formosus]PSK21368.1 ABC transporter ATP-binding protein [Brevibacillus sp. NRRL NRS-603]
MSDYVIETWELTKQYNGKAGCKNITLQVPRGSVFGFLGQNGAGKSTFVRTMLGLLHPTNGKAVMLGQPIGSVESRKKVGYLPELFRYPDWLTGQQLLEHHAEVCGLTHRESKSVIKNVVELVGMAGRERERIRGFSKGMQQRIGIACALLSDPELIFLDEPTSALDPIGRKEVRELIARLRDQGKTVFLNSHLLSEMESVCNYVGIIHRSELVVQGDWRKLSTVQPQIELTVDKDSAGFPNELPSFVTESRLVRQEENRNTWLMTLDQDNRVPALLQQLIASGAGVHEVVRKQHSLEDVFLYWVQKKEGERHVADHQNHV